ncbi:MAG: methylmalonyl-CoA mutase family protein, partial [Pseudomonadota bacterium]
DRCHPMPHCSEPTIHPRPMTNATTIAPDAPLNPFPDANVDDWRALVDKALKDVPFESLTTTTLDGIEIAPLYTRADTVDLPIVNAWSGATRALDIAREGATPWDIRTLHAETDPAQVNAAVLEDLVGGASSVCLQMAASGQHGLPARLDAIDAALAGAHTDMIHTSLLAGDQYIGGALALQALWDARDAKAGQRRGAVNADPLGHLARTGQLEEKLYDTLRTLAHFIATNHAEWPDVTLMLADARPYHEAGASEAQELAAMLATFVSYLRLGDEDGIAPYKVLPKIAVALAADADIFLNLAKIRAARLLIGRVAEACGAEMFADTVPIWITTSERMMSTMDRHNNMLRTTSAAASAVMAGADAITVLPFDWAEGTNDAMARRMARNTQIMLAEESHFGRVADPASGAWYVEHLTDALARNAWEKFQALETGHGIEEALRTGSLQDEIAATADQRRKAIADGDAPLVGVSQFPPADASPAAAARYKAAVTDGTPGEKIRPLERLRLAEPYETAARTAHETGATS